jgi:hypothetical protein
MQRVGLTISLSVVLVALVSVSRAATQNAANDSPVTFTAEQDHQNMMDQLGIKQVRPGSSGDESAPNHANYDPATANPFPNYPDALTMNNGHRVTTPEMWWQQRRPEIVENMELEVYGHVPKSLPKVIWTVTVTDKEFVGRIPVIAKQLVGHVDNSACPQINVNLSMLVVVPAEAKGGVPVLMMFGRSVLPNPTQPTPEEIEQINTKLKALLIQSDPAIKAIFELRRAFSGPPVQRLPVPKSSEYPAFRRDHCAVGRPSVRVTCLPFNRCGQPVGESSHVSCRP